MYLSAQRDEKSLNESNEIDLLLTLVKEDYADLKKHEDSDLWMAFVELEVRTSQVANIIDFCFDHMPSLIEIIEPEELKLSGLDVSSFLNDLQAKLHSVDMLAKQMKMENQLLNRSLSALLSNYITLLLQKSNLNAEQLTKLTGVSQDILEDFLDRLIDQGKIDMKEGIYFLKEEKPVEAKHGRERKKG